MKRCPACKRVENDDALTFCRADGTALVSDSGSIRAETGTAKFGSAPVSSEIETSILPHVTDASINRPTAPTTVLPAQQPPSTTRELIKPRRRRAVMVVLLITAVVAAAIVVGGYFYYSRKSNTTIESIAVLPFVNQNHDADSEYLSDGVTESIINSLTQLPNLKVIARSSVFHYKGKESDPLTVGTELGVRAVLTGRITQRGENITISAELTDVHDNKQLWGEKYERKASDLMSLQRDIAGQIANNLRLKISGEEHNRMMKHYTENPEAYQLYLQGLYYWNKRTPEDLRKSIVLFQKATEKDPSYAQAYAGLALAYAVLPDNSTTSIQETKEIRSKESAASRRAQELDDSLAEIHADLANLKKHNWDFAAAEIEYKRAIELNPNYATARQWYSEFLSDMGRRDEAFAEINKAHEIDPFSRAINGNIGLRFLEARRFDEAIAQFKKVIEMEPNYALGHKFLAPSYEAKGMYPEAIAENRIAETLLGKETAESSERKAAAFTEALKAGGAQGYWRKHLELGLKEYEQGYETAFDIAVDYARLGDKDHAFEWLEKSFATHEEGLSYAKAAPAFDGLSSDPRFPDLLRRVGLPQ